VKKPEGVILSEAKDLGSSITTCLWNPTPGTIGNMPAP
jgi:hypothetical protein